MMISPPQVLGCEFVCSMYWTHNSLVTHYLQTPQPSAVRMDAAASMPGLCAALLGSSAIACTPGQHQRHLCICAFFTIDFVTACASHSLLRTLPAYQGGIKGIYVFLHFTMSLWELVYLNRQTIVRVSHRHNMFDCAFDCANAQLCAWVNRYTLCKGWLQSQPWRKPRLGNSLSISIWWHPKKRYRKGGDN